MGWGSRAERQFDHAHFGLKFRYGELEGLNPIVEEVVLRATWWQRINPLFWWSQRRYASPRKVLQEVERFSMLIRDVETACELQKVGQSVPLNKPSLYRSPHGIREQLVRALKTDHVLRRGHRVGQATRCTVSRGRHGRARHLETALPAPAPFHKPAAP